MEWSDHAIVLVARKHGEGHAVLDVLSQDKGRAKGYVRGGSSRKQRPVLEAGNLVDVTWRGRLNEHLGTFRVELIKATAPDFFKKPSRLAALDALTSLLVAALPEHEPCPAVYKECLVFFTMLGDPETSDTSWGAELVRLEVMLLKTLGFGLDLKSCAATGEVENLMYVSPKTGRAVSAGAGEAYKDKLLPLPGFIITEDAATSEDIQAGLGLTGYFLERHLLHQPNPGVMDARVRLIGYFS